jgi:hypothetical protein
MARDFKRIGTAPVVLRTILVLLASGISVAWLI